MILCDQMFFSAAFLIYRKCLKTLLHETSQALYNLVWVIDWAHDESRRYVLGYACTQLGHSARASATTETEGISTVAIIACVVAAQLQLL